LLDALLKTGQALECNDCQDRKDSAGYYCDFCPETRNAEILINVPRERIVEPVEPTGRPKDDSIVLL
jgi:hypothetical protein